MREITRQRSGRRYPRSHYTLLEKAEFDLVPKLTCVSPNSYWKASNLPGPQNVLYLEYRSLKKELS